MRKFLLIFLILVIISFKQIKAVQRTVLAEEFTATWCVWCPWAAEALRQLKNETQDSLVIIAYHGNDDPFNNADASARFDYYQVDAIPTVYMDGVLYHTGGYDPYPYYRDMFNQRKNIPSPTDFTLSGDYDNITRYGTLEITLRNNGQTTISGYLRIAMTLLDTPYEWYNQTHLEWVLLDLLPSATGLQYTISPNETINYTQDFYIEPQYDENKIEFVVFLQDDNTKEVYGASSIDLVDFNPVVIEERIHEKDNMIHILPGRDKFRIQVGVNFQAILEIYNSSGRKMLKRSINQGIYEFRFSPGVYFYKILGKKIIEGKFLIY